jgi:hypothetical protein
MPAFDRARRSRNWGRAAAALTLTLASLAFGAGAAADSAEASSLRYFGYFAARLTKDGGDHLPEVAFRSNLDWVQISDPDRYRPGVLDHCHRRGCVISTGNEFFRNCDGVHKPECELYPNYAERWGHLADAVRSRIGKVGAFYLMDEPQYRGATPTELATAARTIKKTFPKTKVMMVEAGPEITSSLVVPASVDWVGFDWYCQPIATIAGKLATLSGRITAKQSLFLLPESAPLAACGSAAAHATDAEIAKLQYQYFALALSNPRVIGMLAFGFWTSGYGSAQLPLTVAAHRNIFAAIVAANRPPPRSDWAVRIRGKTITVGRRGPLAVHLRCPKKNARACKGKLALRMRLGKNRRNGASRKRWHVIGTHRFRLIPGRAGTVRVGITRRVRGRLLRLAHRRHKVRVKVRATTKAGVASRLLKLARAR